MSTVKTEAWERWSLAAILLAALALRVYKLDAPLWFDEIATLVDFVRAPTHKLIADYSSFNNHLFFSLQAKLATALFGESAWALRLPAVLFGMGSIWLAWRLARRVTSPATALVVAALLATSYHHIWFSQNARGYTELMFWSLAALVVFVEGIGERSLGRWALFAVCLAAAMYTHLTAAFFVAALGLTYVVMLLVRWLAPERGPALLMAPKEPAAQWAPFWGFVAGGVLTLVLCAPALPQMVSLVSSVKETSDVDVMQEYRNPIWTALEGVRTLGGGNPLVALGAPLALALAALGAVGLWRRDPVLVLVAVLQIPITIIALSLVSMRIWPRFFFTEFAFVFLFMAHGVFLTAGFVAGLAKRFLRLPVTQAQLFGLATAIMMGASLLLAARNYTAPKQNFVAAIDLLTREGAPASSVGAVGWAAYPYTVYYHTGWRQVRAQGDLSALTPAAGRRWVVAAFPERTSRENVDVWTQLEQSYEMIAYFPGTLGDGGVLVYRSTADGGS